MANPTRVATKSTSYQVAREVCQNRVRLCAQRQSAGRRQQQKQQLGTTSLHSYLQKLVNKLGIQFAIVAETRAAVGGRGPSLLAWGFSASHAVVA